MATSASTKLPIGSPGGNSVFQGWPMKGRKSQVTSAKTSSEEKEIAGATKLMKQVGKKKSERGKSNISLVSDQKTVWHVASLGCSDQQESGSKFSRQASSSSALSKLIKTNVSPTKKLTSIPPPPSNPPPILNRSKLSDSKEDIVGKESEMKETTHIKRKDSSDENERGMKKSKSFGKWTSVLTTNTITGRQEDIEGVETRAVDNVRKKGVKMARGDRKSPPKHPPPQSSKAKASAVIGLASPDHTQSSSHSASSNGKTELQKETQDKKQEEEGKNKYKLSRGRAISAGNKLVISGRSADRGTTSVHPSAGPNTTLTSYGGGVRNLTRFFSGGSKEEAMTDLDHRKDKGGLDSPTQSPVIERRFKSISNRHQNEALKANAQFPIVTSSSSFDVDYDNQGRKIYERDSVPGSNCHEPLTFPPSKEGPKGCNQGNSPPHTSASTWYGQNYQNVFSDPVFARFDKRDPSLSLSSSPSVPFSADLVVSRSYQNVFDDEVFARFDRTKNSGMKKDAEKEKLDIAKSHTSHNEFKYDSATEGMRGLSGSGSWTEKKPKPLPRKNSQLGSVSNSEASAFSPVRESEDDLSDVYEIMQSKVISKHNSMTKETQSGPNIQDLSQLEVTTDTCIESKEEEESVKEKISGDEEESEMIVFGAQDPDWAENFQKLLELEIDMAEEFDSSSQFNDTLCKKEKDDPVKGVGHPGSFEIMAEKKKHQGGISKKSLGKVVSHMPMDPSIFRQNTSKQKRLLRQGICSADDQLNRQDSDLDDYIPMNPVRLSASLQIASLTPAPSNTSMPPKVQSLSQPESLHIPSMDPRLSAGYLKILPYDTPTPSPLTLPSLQTPSPTTASTGTQQQPIRHHYIEIDIPDSPIPVFFPLPRKFEAKPPKIPPKNEKDNFATGNSTQALPTNTTRRKLKYSEVEVVRGSTSENKIVSERTARMRAITKYSQVTVGLNSASESPSSGSPFSSPQLKRSQGSVFAKEMMKYVNRPLPPTPSGNIYYSTVNHPLPNVQSMRTPIWHEYVEIDEDELNQKRSNAVPDPQTSKLNLTSQDKKTSTKIVMKEEAPHLNGSEVRGKKESSLTPPPVPRRSSCPYVEIDGENLEKMAMSVSPSSIFAKLRENKVSEDPNMTSKEHSFMNSLPTKMAQKIGDPPEVPQRPEQFQRRFSSSGEYSYAMVPGIKFQWLSKHSKHEVGQGCFMNAGSPMSALGQSSSSNAKNNMMSPIKETSAAEKWGVNQPPTIPPKTESLLREQGLLPTHHAQKPSPYLKPCLLKEKKRKMSSPDIFNHSVSSTHQEFQYFQDTEDVAGTVKESKQERRRDISSNRGSSSPEHLKSDKQVIPPSRPPPPTINPYEKREQSPKSWNGSSGKDQSPKNSNKQKSEEIKVKNNGRMQENAGKGDRAAALSPDLLRVKKGGLEHYINRNSLALIMQNKDVIERQLEKERESQPAEREKGQTSDEAERPKKEDNSSSKQQGTEGRGLGEILLEVDSLLQQQVCSEEDLIAAIELQLKIKLQPVKEKTNEGREEVDGGKIKDEEKRESRFVDSVPITQQDVDDVVSFMNENKSKHVSEGEAEEKDEAEEDVRQSVFEIAEASELDGNSVVVKSDEDLVDLMNEPLSPKQRSSTFVIIDDADLPPCKQHRGTNKSSVTNRSPVLGAAKRMDLLPEGELPDSPSPDFSVRDEMGWGAEDRFPTGERMRENRSSSLNVSPLRRVNARRKTNPASDMRKINAGKVVTAVKMIHLYNIYVHKCVYESTLCLNFVQQIFSILDFTIIIIYIYRKLFCCFFIPLSVSISFTIQLFFLFPFH